MNLIDPFNRRRVDADEIIQTRANVELGIVRFATSHARLLRQRFKWTFILRRYRNSPELTTNHTKYTNKENANMEIVRGVAIRGRLKFRRYPRCADATWG